LVSTLEDCKLSGASIERVLYLLSAFYRWAIGQGVCAVNPVVVFRAGLTKPKRKALHTQHDPKDTPFIGSRADIARVFQGLPSPSRGQHPSGLAAAQVHSDGTADAGVWQLALFDSSADGHLAHTEVDGRLGHCHVLAGCEPLDGGSQGLNALVQYFQGDGAWGGERPGGVGVGSRSARRCAGGSTAACRRSRTQTHVASRPGLLFTGTVHAR
jgi:hypothetical protein